MSIFGECPLQCAGQTHEREIRTILKSVERESGCPLMRKEPTCPLIEEKREKSCTDIYHYMSDSLFKSKTPSSGAAVFEEMEKFYNDSLSREANEEGAVRRILENVKFDFFVKKEVYEGKWTIEIGLNWRDKDGKTVKDYRNSFIRVQGNFWGFPVFRFYNTWEEGDWQHTRFVDLKTATLSILFEKMEKTEINRSILMGLRAIAKAELSIKSFCDALDPHAFWS